MLPNSQLHDFGSHHLVGTSPAHKHRLLTSTALERSDFLQSVLRWTLSILQQESQIDKGFFPN